MPEATDRPQDRGRSHARKVTPAPATAEILDRYRAAMRGELGRVLDELEAGTGVQASMDGAGDRPVGLGITARKERWDLAIRLGRELAAANDGAGSVPDASPGLGRRAGSAPPRLTKRDRAVMGE